MSKDDSKKAIGGAAVGAGIGGLLGGPAGAIVGATIGAIVANPRKRSEPPKAKKTRRVTCNTCDGRGKYTRYQQYGDGRSVETCPSCGGAGGWTVEDD